MRGVPRVFWVESIDANRRAAIEGARSCAGRNIAGGPPGAKRVGDRRSTIDNAGLLTFYFVHPLIEKSPRLFSGRCLSLSISVPYAATVANKCHRDVNLRTSDNSGRPFRAYFYPTRLKVHVYSRVRTHTHVSEEWHETFGDGLCHAERCILPVARLWWYLVDASAPGRRELRPVRWLRDSG